MIIFYLNKQEVHRVHESVLVPRRGDLVHLPSSVNTGGSSGGQGRVKDVLFDYSNGVEVSVELERHQ